MKQTAKTAEILGSAAGSDVANTSASSQKAQASLDSIIDNIMISGIDQNNKTFQELKQNLSLDDQHLLSVMKNLKQLPQKKLAPIERLFTSKAENIPGSLMNDVLTVFRELTSKQSDSAKKEAAEESGEDLEDEDDTSSNDGSQGQGSNEPNLMQSVKENIDQMLSSNSLKRKIVNKRWWTPQEVFLIVDS